MPKRPEGWERTSAQPKTGTRGIKQVTGGRVYPDGGIIRYRQAAILANVKNPRNVYTRGDPVDLARLETVIDSRYMSLAEREQIHDLRSRGESMRAIGRVLGRSVSTISRELARNTPTTSGVQPHTTLGYLPYTAHHMAAARRPRQHERKLQDAGDLRTLRGDDGTDAFRRRSLLDFRRGPAM